MARHVTSAGPLPCLPGRCPGAGQRLRGADGARWSRIHGQAEQERLTEADRQRQLLDRFAGAPALEPLARYSESLGRGSRGTDGVGSTPCRGPESGSRDRSAEVWSGRDRADRTGSGEDVALAAEALRLQSADDLRDSAQSAVQALAGPDDEAGGALAMLYAARKVFESAVSRDPAATQLGERLAECELPAQRSDR